GALQQLFEVTPTQVPTSTVQASADENQPDPADQVLNHFKALAKTMKENERKAAAIIGEQSRFSANMWIRRTGWPRHLRGFDREWLAAIAQPRGPENPEERTRGNGEGEGEGKPAASDDALARVLLAVERVIWRAQQASRVDVVGSAAINYISRREAGGDSNEKPFHAEQKGQTMEWYTESWKLAVAYIW
ncbi:hypothetical protein QBC36DRAFT_199118, partial [Triangularia setosa]